MAAPVYFGGKPFSNAPIRQRSSVIASTGATVTIPKSASGSIYLLDRAALVYTLPAPKVGMWFVFIGTIIATGQSIVTSAGTVFVQGSISVASSTTRGDFAGNGTSHVRYDQNGSTKGGAAVGGIIYAYCLTATLWQFDGQLNGSGTAATGFA